MAFHKKRSFGKKRSYKKKSWGKKSKKSWSRKYSHRSQKSNFASSTETYDFGTFTPVTDIGAQNANLATILPSNFTRSAQIATNYRFYRISKVTYDYMPEANTFQAGTGSAESIPRFLSVMCRDGNFNGVGPSGAGTVQDLKEMGAKYRPFLKPIKISYAPNVCTAVSTLDATGAISATQVMILRKKSPWLSTQAESTSGAPPASGLNWVHYGHQWQVCADQFGSGAVAGSLKITAHFEFKLPLAFAP